MQRQKGPPAHVRHKLDCLKIQLEEKRKKEMEFSKELEIIDNHECYGRIRIENNVTSVDSEQLASEQLIQDQEDECADEDLDNSDSLEPKHENKSVSVFSARRVDYLLKKGIFKTITATITRFFLHYLRHRFTSLVFI